MTRTKLFALAMVAALAACSGDDEDAPKPPQIQGSCNDVEASGYCEEYFNISPADLATAESDCEGMGTWSTNPCPSGDASCTYQLEPLDVGYASGTARWWFYGLASEQEENIARGLCVMLDGTYKT